MNLNLSNTSISLRVVMLLCWIGLASCERRSQYVRYNDIPSDVLQTTLLVEKFTEKDPVVYDPVYMNGKDSLLWRKSGFRDSLVGKEAGKPGNERDEEYEKRKRKAKEAEAEKEEEPLEFQHPLIVKTNIHLEEYNRKLAESIEQVYPGPVEMIDSTDPRYLDSAYSNKDKYRYILRYKPVVHCYENPNGETLLKYTYMYYFYDRKDELKYPDIELFSSQPWKTTRVILFKAGSKPGS